MVGQYRSSTWFILLTVILLSTVVINDLGRLHMLLNGVVGHDNVAKANNFLDQFQVSPRMAARMARADVVQVL